MDPGKADKNKIRQEALAFVKQNLVAVVATSYNDIPHAAATYYLVDDDFNFYFLTKNNTSKYLNAAVNDSAAIVVGTGPKHATVQARGNMDILVGDESQLVIDAFDNIYSRDTISEWPIDVLEKFKNEDYVAMRFIPYHLTFINIDDENYAESLSKEVHTIISQ